MALIIFQQSFNVFQAAIGDESIVETGPTRVVLERDGISYNFDGAFTLDAGGNVIGGIIEDIFVNDAVQSLLQAFSVNVDAPTFFATWFAGDVQGVADLVLSGVDDVRGSFGDDTVFVGAGNDVFQGSAGDDLVFGEEGEDQLTGDSGNDTLVGGEGNDTLWGGADADVLTGGDGADVFQFVFGDAIDVITDFEDGVDVINIAAGGLTFDDVSMTAIGPDTVVSVGDISFIVQGTAPEAIGAEDFLFA